MIRLEDLIGDDDDNEIIINRIKYNKNIFKKKVNDILYNSKSLITDYMRKRNTNLFHVLYQKNYSDDLRTYCNFIFNDIKRILIKYNEIINCSYIQWEKSIYENTGYFDYNGICCNLDGFCLNKASPP